MSKMIATALAAAVTALSFAASPALAQKRLKVATLSCRLPASVGTLEPARMRCSSVSARGRIERYSGTVTQFAPDLGIAAGGTMRWSVLMTTRPARRGALAGHYVEAGRDVSPGAGAKALVGGAQQSTVLRPYSVRSRSVRARASVNLAAGVTGLTIRYRSE